MSFFQSLSCLGQLTGDPEQRKYCLSPVILEDHLPTPQIALLVGKHWSNVVTRSLLAASPPNSSNAKRDLWCLFQHLPHIPWRSCLSSKPRSHCFQLCHAFGSLSMRCLHLSLFSWFSVGSHVLVPLDLDQQGAGRLGVPKERKEDMKAPCKHREKNSRHLEMSFSLNSCCTSCLCNLIEDQQMCLWLGPSHPTCSTLTQVLFQPNSCVPLQHTAPARLTSTNQDPVLGTLGQDFEGQCWGILYLTVAAWQSLPMDFWCPPEIPVLLLLLPDPFTIHPIHLLVLTAGLEWPREAGPSLARPRVVPAGAQSWQAPHSWCLPAGRDAGFWRSCCSARIQRLAQPVFPSGRSSKSPCCFVLGDGSEGKEEMVIPVHD